LKTECLPHKDQPVIAM